MSGRDKAHRLGAVFVLVFCACSLAVHFVAEGFSPAGAPGFNLLTETRQTHLVHEHSDDHFVLIRLIPSSLNQSPALLLYPALSRAFSYSIPPLLPPPNF